MQLEGAFRGADVMNQWFFFCIVKQVPPWPVLHLSTWFCEIIQVVLVQPGKQIVKQTDLI